MEPQKRDEHSADIRSSGLCVHRASVVELGLEFGCGWPRCAVARFAIGKVARCWRHASVGAGRIQFRDTADYESALRKKCEELTNGWLAADVGAGQICREMSVIRTCEVVACAGNARTHLEMGPGLRASTDITHRQRFLRACRCQPLEYPPVWLMRQAGRVLPEYRELKEKYSFLQLVQTPELAAEVTLQPIRRFDFDAAIIFSDILVVPEAMGQGYHFREIGGVAMDFAIQSAADIAKLSARNIVEKLHYVAEAIRMVKRELVGRTALLGFAGSPWTLANFMLEGGSAKEHTKALALFRNDRSLFEALCEKLTDAVITFLRMQIGAGVDAVQIFDSHGGLIPLNEFQATSGVWIRHIIAALANRVPVILFSKGARDWASLANTGAQAISVDQDTTLTEAGRRLPETVALQGNLDPARLIHDTPAMIEKETRRLLAEMDGRNGYIFNLGHGVPPAARLENIQAVVDAIRSPQDGVANESPRVELCPGQIT